MSLGARRTIAVVYARSVARGGHLVRMTAHGRVSITSHAIAQIVGHTAAECYGVVGMTGRRRLPRLRRRDRLTDGIDVEWRADGLMIDVHVAVEYGLNLAEVASTLRSRVAYEVERHTGLRVARVEVHVDDVKSSA